MFTAENDISQWSIGQLLSRCDSPSRALGQSTSGILVFVQVVACKGNIWSPELRLTKTIMYFVLGALYRVLVFEDRAYSCEHVCLHKR